MAAGEDLLPMLDSLEAHDAVTLTPVERMLLATDGTVTHMLEALTRAHVGVDILDRTVDGATLTREVALRRSLDGSVLTWARSEVNTYPLPMEVEEALVSGDKGIGDVLREHYAEQRREITDMGVAWSDDDDLPRFIDDGSTLYLRRTYKVYSDESNIMKITEWFPKGLF